MIMVFVSGVTFWAEARSEVLNSIVTSFHFVYYGLPASPGSCSSKHGNGCATHDQTARTYGGDQPS